MTLTRPTPSLLAALLVAFLIHSGTAAAAPPSEAAKAARIPSSSIFPVEQVKEGMRGTGYSVFSGTKVDSFSVEILGVLKGYRPGFDLIMSRASSPVLDKTGIIAGMSGSPVYIDGKLVGAVSYTWSFLKEPLAGITPIRQMLELFPAPGADMPHAEDPFGALGAPPKRSDEPMGGARPIATPIAIAGFTSEALRYLEPWLTERGFVASPGGASAPGGSCDSLRAGSAVGVQLIRGDWSAAALGTVTYREGDRLLALGHPFLAMGWMDLPMTAATIHTVMSSQQISNKVGSPTVACGAIIADRSAGIAGIIGAVPSMIPVAVSIQGSGGRSREYHFEVARSRYLTPALVSASVVNSISETLFDAGVTTVRYNLALHMNGGARTIRRGDVFITPSPVSGVGETVNQTLTLLLGDRFRPSRLDSARVLVKVEEGIDEAALIGVRAAPALVVAGDSLDLDLTFRRPGKVLESKRVRVRVPPATPDGELMIRVCDADDTERWEMQRAPERYQPETFEQLAQLIESGRASDRIYVQLYRPASGAVVGGREISQAPPSVLEVLGAGPTSGEASSTKGATLAEISVPMGRVVRGCESSTVTVIPGRR
jgi:hypothetical protein